MTAFRLFILVIAAVVFAQINNWRILDQLAVALVALLVVAFAWSRASLRGIAVTRQTATDRAQVGEILTERITLRNGARLAKLWLEVRDLSTLPGHQASRVLHVRGRSAATWAVETICAKRGRFRVGPLLVRSGDPFGLFPSSLTVPVTLDLLVYPAAVDVTGFPLPSGILSGGSETDRRTPFVNPSVSGIREYAPGDAFNRISWSVTARTGRLMVKEFDHDPTSDVWIVLDLDERQSLRASRPLAATDRAVDQWPVEAWLDATEEYAVTIASSLAHRCLSQGRSVGLIAAGAHHEVIPAERSDRQYVKILETLAVVEADGHQPLAEVLVAESRRFTRQSTVVVVTSSTDEMWAQSLADIAGRRVRAAAIVVEAETFAQAPSSLMVVSGLVAAGIPTHLVKYGDSISAALSAAGAIAPSVGR